jgi:hypothetical protein
MLGVITLEPGGPAVAVLSEIALFTALFTNGQQIGIREVRKAYRLPGRALFLRMPLTFGITAVLGVWAGACRDVDHCALINGRADRCGIRSDGKRLTSMVTTR